MAETTLATVRIGNTARSIDGNKWKWQMAVDTNDYTALISHVVLHLHPTFKNNRIEILCPADGVFKSGVFTGWGTFAVGVDLHWKNETVTPLEHHLVFEEGGPHQTRLTVEIPAMYTHQPEQPEGAMEPGPEPVIAPSEPELMMELPDRGMLEMMLKNTPWLKHDNPHFWHGRGYQGVVVQPTCTWKSNLKPRDDHDAPEWLTASEFTDADDVLDSKLEQLAILLQLSRKTVIYSGAGISRAAGIGQAARGGAAGGRKTTEAVPTFTHYALGALSRSGLLHGWVQQNHDGLPQKAGFPQENVNEIHGSWYDPSNPVVKYSGNLKEDAFPWMEHDADTADLVLVLGTSLGGLNADQVAIKTASRSCKGRALGMVMINLQQTEQDGKATLRLFGKSDDVLKKLLQRMNISPGSCSPATFSQEPRVLVPYDADGNRSDTVKMWLDLRPGAQVKLTAGHNIQGAKQPAYMHIGNTQKSTVNGRRCGPGHGSVVKWDDVRCSVGLEIEGASMRLGQWWLEAAMRGGPDTLPVVNLDPKIVAQ